MSLIVNQLSLLYIYVDYVYTCTKNTYIYIYTYTYTLATLFAEIIIFERCILWQYKSILTCWTHAAGEMVNECAHMVKVSNG